MLMTNFLTELSLIADEYEGDEVPTDDIGVPVYVAVRITERSTLAVFVTKGDEREIDNALKAQGNNFLIVPVGTHDGVTSQADFIRRVGQVFA